MQRRDINAADAPAPAGQYTQAVEVTGATRTLYFSGQVGVAADGSIPSDAEAQCALAWRNLQAQLHAAGMEITNLVKITTIVRDPADTVALRAGRAAVLGNQQAGEPAHHWRPQQSGVEGRGGGNCGRMIRHGQRRLIFPVIDGDPGRRPNRTQRVGRTGVGDLASDPADDTHATRSGPRG